MASRPIYSVKDQTIDNLLRGAQDRIFYVPHYQRRYSWKKDQWEDLWDDVYSLGKDDKQFLGSIVVVTGQYSLGLNKLELIDGQQRLACISILLIAIKDYLEEQGEITRVQTITEALYNFDLDKRKLSDKLELGSLDKEDYKCLLKSDLVKVKNDYLKETYEHFKNKIAGIGTIEKVKDFHYKLMRNVFTVLITVSRDQDAYRLFESLNDRGLELSPVDLMKNRLFRISDERMDVDLEKIKELWSQIIINLDGVDEERFFRHYFMSAKALKIPEKVTVPKLYDQFQKILKNLEKYGLKIRDFIENIAENSALYSKIWNAKTNKFSPASSNDRINIRLQNLNDIGAIPSYTLLLRMFTENLGREDATRILELIEKFSIRRIIGRLPTRELDTIYNHLAHNAFEKEDPVEYIRNYLKGPSRVPADDLFKKRFKETDFKNNSQTKYILGEIELKHFRGLKTPDRRSSYDVHIEHIAPQRTFARKSRSPWKKYLGVGKEEFEKHKSRIGNLIPLEGKLNQMAHDKSFEQKKKYYADSDFQMAKRLCDCKNWSIEKINERNEELADAAAEIWKL